MGRVIVIGAGVVGLALARELLRRGSDVLVVDRGQPGAGCSAGNAGWIVPSYSTPLPAPGLTATSLRWMLRRDSPLFVRPRLSPSFGAWMLRFWRHCRPEPYDRGLNALAALNARTMPLFDELLADGVPLELHRQGLLFAGLSREVVDRHCDDLAFLERIGYRRPRPLTGGELRDIEPALSDAVAAGFLVPEERHVRPETLASGLAGWLRGRGVEIRSGVDVARIQHRAGRASAAITNRGALEADQFVVAAGAWSGSLLRRCGLALPIEAGKGYSITIERPTFQLRQPVDLIEPHVACTPFDGSLRIAGTMELSGLNLTLRRERIEAIRRAGAHFFRGWPHGAEERVWVGMRPLTPDGLPAIGAMPGVENLFVASGHAMLGVTLAPATAEALAATMAGVEHQIDLGPFDPARFSAGTRTSRSSDVSTGRSLAEA